MRRGRSPSRSPVGPGLCGTIQQCQELELQLSVFLPNDLSLDDWCAGVYALPTWPEASMLGADYLRKVVGYDFHLLRKKYDVQSMWGDLDPQWRLLKSQLVSTAELLSSEHANQSWLGPCRVDYTGG